MPATRFKRCHRCKRRKPIGHFGDVHGYGGRDVRDSHCLTCRARINRALEAEEFGVFGRTAEFEEGVRLRIAEMRAVKRLTEGEPHNPHHWTPPVVRVRTGR